MVWPHPTITRFAAAYPGSPPAQECTTLFRTQFKRNLSGKFEFVKMNYPIFDTLAPTSSGGAHSGVVVGTQMGDHLSFGGVAGSGWLGQGEFLNIFTPPWCHRHPIPLYPPSSKKYV